MYGNRGLTETVPLAAAERGACSVQLRPDGAGHPAVSAALSEQIVTIPAERFHEWGGESPPHDGASIAGGLLSSRHLKQGFL